MLPAGRATSRSPPPPPEPAKSSASTSRPACSSGRGGSRLRSSGSRAICSRSRSLLRASTPRRSASASGTFRSSSVRSQSCGGCFGPAAAWRCSRSPVRAASSVRSSPSGSIGSCRSSDARSAPAPPTPTCPPPFGAARLLDRRAAHGDGRVNTLAAVDATPGLAAYMAELETRLERAVGRRPGFAAEVAGEALTAGGKRLRPLLCFLSSRSTTEPPFAAGVAVELVHMATLVHDDLVDGARMRRGVPAAWAVFGADAALAAGDYLFACAFAELADTGESHGVTVLADACLALARGEALQRRQRREPDTTIDDYLTRCALKTGK